MKHGMCKTKFYILWTNINQRCNNKNKPDYKHYGGRGIKVEWKCFEDFYNDMFEKYKEGLELDRTDNNGNYCKKNCKFIDRKGQVRNTRRNRVIKYKGMSKIMIEWSEYLGINYVTLKSRINDYGWSIKKSFETPVHHNNKKL